MLLERKKNMTYFSWNGATAYSNAGYIVVSVRTGKRNQTHRNVRPDFMAAKRFERPRIPFVKDDFLVTKIEKGAAVLVFRFEKGTHHILSDVPSRKF